MKDRLSEYQQYHCTNEKLILRVNRFHLVRTLSEQLEFLIHVNAGVTLLPVKLGFPKKSIPILLDTIHTLYRNIKRGIVPKSETDILTIKLCNDLQTLSNAPGISKNILKEIRNIVEELDL